MYRKKIIFTAAFISILFFGMAITTLGSIVPELTERFRLNEVGLGLVFTILPFGILFGSLLFGPICDRFGYKFLLAFACFSMFIGFQGIAFANANTVLLICVFLFGLGGGIINGATSALISDISAESKGANLSFLGVFFGIGAFAMPLALGFLRKSFSYEIIISSIGWATFLMGLFYIFIGFPAPKQLASFPLKSGFKLLKEKVLILTSFFLFFQSALEGIVNNWTPTFLTSVYKISHEKALLALSISVLGMIITRVAFGSILKNISFKQVWIISFSALFIGIFLLGFVFSFYAHILGLFLIGAGLAAGFPIMLGFLGEQFKSLSGTAFSIAFTIALGGNMIINYAMGWIAKRWGIENYINVVLAELIIMAILCMLILQRKKKLESPI